MNSSDDDNSLFRDTFGDIQRVTSDKVEEYKNKPRPKPRQIYADEASGQQAISPFPELPGELELDPDFYYFRKDGVQDKVFKQMKRGQHPVRDAIDLHGMTREVALAELEMFVSECQQRNFKHVLIVHGKGYKSEHRAILKPSVAIWLKQMPSVLAFCPALPKDGGHGAMYVLLKRA